MLQDRSFRCWVFLHFVAATAYSIEKAAYEKEHPPENESDSKKGKISAAKELTKAPKVI